jgi:hypothetical protein
MRRFILIFLLLLTLCGFKSSTIYADSNQSQLGQEMVKLGLKFLDNPGDFFFNLHSDNEDFSPLPSFGRIGFRFNGFPTFLPLTWANLNVKAKVLSELGNTPQVDLIGTYGNLLALNSVGGDVKPSFYDYSLGATVSKNMEDGVRLYCGVKYSAVVMDLSFDDPVELGSFSMTRMNFKYSDTTLFTGFMRQSSPETLITAQVGYGLQNNKIVSRIMLSKKHVEYGMDIFPEGVFVFHPFIAWHWYIADKGSNKK